MTTTEKAKHTPGPWRWVETPSAHTLDYPPNTPDKEWDGKSQLDNYPCFDCLRGGDDGPSVLSGGWCNDSTADVCIRSAEDARLIAAAPEMLEALERVIPWIPTEDQCCDQDRIEIRELHRAIFAAISKAKGGQ